MRYSPTSLKIDFGGLEMLKQHAAHVARPCDSLNHVLHNGADSIDLADADLEPLRRFLSKLPDTVFRCIWRVRYHLSCIFNAGAQAVARASPARDFPAHQQRNQKVFESPEARRLRVEISSCCIYARAELMNMSIQAIHRLGLLRIRTASEDVRCICAQLQLYRVTAELTQ
jgi:hypothetical protein